MTAPAQMLEDSPAGLTGLNATPGLDEPASPGRPKKRRGMLIATGVGLLAILLALVAFGAGSSSGAAYDPRSATPGGTRALAELLRERGIASTRGTGYDADTTVFVAFPYALSSSQRDDLLDSGADVVLHEPGSLSGADVSRTGSQDVQTRDPACSYGPAETAGSVRLGGQTFSGPKLAVECYGGSLLTVPPQTISGVTGRLTLLGSADFLTNDRLDEQGNAALAIALLSGKPKVTWYFGQPATDEGSKTLTDLLPSGVKWALLQLGIALLFVAAWRARRLGPVVTEPLPVVVRAAETVLGRARLYASARARTTAAEALRHASRGRLAGLIHLDPNAAPQVMISAVAARTGTDPARVAGLLYSGGGYGSAESEAALVRLANDLDTLERLAHSSREVARP